MSIHNRNFSGWLAKNVIKPVHASVVLSTRVEKLGQFFAHLIPNHPQTGLDVGCGSGELAMKIQHMRPDVKLSGVDVLARKNTTMKVIEFDGLHLPFEDKSFDFVLISDVLHHTRQPEALLMECKRVAASFILIKDHICDSEWDRQILSLMDWVGNKSYGVALPYNYLSSTEWTKIYDRLGLSVEERLNRLNLYPQPLSLLFDRSLHFVVKLAVF